MDRSQIVRHDYGVHEQPRILRTFAACQHRDPTRVPRPGHVTTYHRHDRLWESGAELIGLNYQRWAPLRRPQVRIRVQHQNYVTAVEAHRRRPFQADPNPRIGPAFDANPQPASRSYLVR